jgi:hypothetical protein
MRCSPAASERSTLTSLQCLGRSRSHAALKTRLFAHHAPLFAAISHFFAPTCRNPLFFPLRLQAVATLDSIVSCHELDVARGYHPNRSTSPPSIILSSAASNFPHTFLLTNYFLSNHVFQLENSCRYRPDSSYSPSHVLHMERERWLGPLRIFR